MPKLKGPIRVGPQILSNSEMLSVDERLTFAVQSSKMLHISIPVSCDHVVRYCQGRIEVF